MNNDGQHQTLEGSRAHAAEADALQAAGKFEEAIAAYERLIAEGHADEYSWGRLADALVATQEFVLAQDAYRTALDYGPEVWELHVNLARPLYLLGDANTAAEHLERALPHVSQRLVLENLATMAPGVPKYGLEDILHLRRAFGRLLADPGKHPARCLEEAGAISLERDEMPLFEGRLQRSRNGDNPLRVAYLSAHFAQPAYMGPVWALINHHDRARHTIYLLSDAAITAPFPDYQTHERDLVLDISKASDDDLAQFIDAQEIDILVDLSGYSYKPRLSLFAKRVAPVVATWFNMYSTSGLPGIDYIIGDDYVITPAEERFYSERVLRLPQSYLTFLPWENRPPVAPSPCAAGVPFTFGSLVSNYKITDPVVEAWVEILKRAPHARLLLANGDLKSTNTKAWVQSRFTSRGIAPERLLFREPAPHDQFLRYYDEIDIALDSFPYSGGTTTMEAIWQGVPVLCHAGTGWAARTSGSILSGTHLREFCCDDVPGYMERAVSLATDEKTPTRLADLRRCMRESLRGCASLDGAGLAQGMEALYAGL